LFSHLLSDLKKKSSKEVAIEEEEEEGSEDEDEMIKDSNNEEEEEIDSENEESDNEEESPSVDNNYVRHFQCVLSQPLFNAISSSPPQMKTTNSTWPALEDIIIQLPECSREKKMKTLEDDEEGSVVKEAEVLKILKTRAMLDNYLEKGINLTKELSAFQMELASIIFAYKDFYFGQRNFNNEDEIKTIYCAHVLNHILKARKLVVGNSKKLKSNTAVDNDDDNVMRDQGFTNSKVLILLPFRESANRVVENIASLLVGEDKSKVYNYKRFLEEFTGNNLSFPKINKKPEDYEKTFAGNTDDTFRIGISIIKRSRGF
jgi:U3 small nucleolar RNA-associated protein 25